MWNLVFCLGGGKAELLYNVRPWFFGGTADRKELPDVRGQADRSSTHINSFGYSNSRFGHPRKYKLNVTSVVWYTSPTFDENLHEHISHELADDVGRESDTS